MKRLRSIPVFVLWLGLAACSRPANEWGDSVVGPDMEQNGPFQNFQHITFSAERRADTPPEAKLTRIELRKGTGEDVATLYNVLSDSKPYLAGVSYHRFTPVIAESNAERKDYWLIGLNLSRTPDRSVYSILRFAQGTNFTPGQSANVEYLSLDCYDLKVARRPVAAYDPANIEKTFEPEIAPEAGECEFNSLTEAYKVTALVLRKYDQIKHFPDAPKPDWLPLTVTVE